MKVLHRGQSLYSDEYFISDSIKFEFNQMYLLVKGKWRECDEATRSINFSDMLDSDGAKIFASLSEDGNGGDILEYIEESDYSDKTKKGKVTLTFNGLHGTKYSFIFNGKYRHYKKENSKVTGIQE